MFEGQGQKKNQKGTRCMQWGTFCPMEGHPRGNLIPYTIGAFKWALLIQDGEF